MSIKKIIKSVGFLTAILAVNLLFSLNVARAADKIDVEFPVGTNISGSKIFDYSNIAPGWEESKTIRVENDSSDYDVNLFFTVDLKSGKKKLAEKLKFYVIRVTDGSYRIGGAGDRYDVEEADGTKLFVDRLSKEKGKEYRIKIVFDKEAGNEYQGLESVFDLEFRIDAIEVEAETEVQILANQGRVVTGEPPIVEGEQTSKEREVVVGEGESEENGVGVAGSQEQRDGWAWLFWTLGSAGFLGIFYKWVLIKKK